MGTELHAQEGYWSPQHGWQLKSNDLTAGEYHAVGLDLQGISRGRLSALKAHLADTEAKLQSGDVSNLTGRDLTGDILQAGVLSYFGVNDAQDALASRENNIVHYREPSFGAFKTAVQTVYNFGVPRTAKFSGVTMDIDRYKSAVVAVDGDTQKKIHYLTATGARTSAFERIVPELMFSTAGERVHGVSAVKALAVAASQGQKLYTITTYTIDTALPQLTVSNQVKSEIRDAVNAGEQVTVSQNPIDYAGWRGVGYIVTNPATGTAAYKISGGASGSSTQSSQKGDLLDTFENPLTDVGAAQSAFSFLAKEGYEVSKIKLSEYKPIIRGAGKFLVLISAYVTTVTIQKKTGKLWKGVDAATIDFSLSYIAGSLAASLFASLGLSGLYIPVIVAIVISLTVAILSTILERKLFNLLYSAADDIGVTPEHDYA